MSKESSLRTLLIQDCISILQSSNLSLARCHAVLVAHLNLHTLWLEFLIIQICLGQFLVGSFKKLVCVVLVKLCLILLKFCLELFLVFRFLVSLCVPHEDIVLCSSLGFSGFGFCLQADEITHNHFQHANNTAVGILHATIRLHLRSLLSEGSALCAVEITEHDKCRFDILGSCLCICNGCLVLFLLGKSFLRCFAHRTSEVFLLLRQCGNLLGHGINLCSQIFNLCHVFFCLGCL